MVEIEEEALVAAEILPTEDEIKSPHEDKDALVKDVAPADAEHDKESSVEKPIDTDKDVAIDVKEEKEKIEIEEVEKAKEEGRTSEMDRIVERMRAVSFDLGTEITDYDKGKHEFIDRIEGKETK